MTAAYVDSSTLIAIAFTEPGGSPSWDLLSSFDELVSSNLLEAEVRSAFAREGRTFRWPEGIEINWIFPDQTLGPELARVLAAGYLRGADLWHMAGALYSAGDSREMHFVTLDNRQHGVAEALGFLT